MSVSVTLLLEEYEDVVSVPEEAVFGSPTEPFVFLDGLLGWEQRPVQLGSVSEGRVIVLEGLDGDETVYLGDPRNGESAT